ncbi:MAG: 16S rRNA (cytosine(1402)-N(4))-methyltransferase RsmH [Bacteroidales bacterium]|nr:16S rRNA (cytosine(1402)-N(4))-methyltransferase RsmH [Bacteroidales bacterium]
MYHVPVLLDAVIEGLQIKPDGVYVDATFGGGGHARAILNKLTTGRLIAFDQDEHAAKNIPDDNRFVFVNNNFRYMKNFLRYLKYEKIQGILADLGVSSYQFDTGERGFSFRSEAELDMRMNPHAEIDAKYILNNYSEQQLADIFYHYGEIRNARCLAKAIVVARSSHAIRTVNDLNNAIEKCLPVYEYYKYMAKVFQAIRIEVNDELNSLKDLLMSATECLDTGGRLVIISYHSLEDRMVKNFIRTGNVEGKTEKDLFGNINKPFRAVNKDVIVPSESEITANNRARSAKLRIAEKI